MHHPPLPEWERQRVRNDDSEVIEIPYGGVSFVFTGDIGREVERQDRAGLRSGADPDSESAAPRQRHVELEAISDALRPDIAIISSGRGNPFGHPVPASWQRYRDIGAAIYRTDQDGAVTVETDGNTVRVRTFTDVD